MNDDPETYTATPFEIDTHLEVETIASHMHDEVPVPMREISATEPERVRNGRTWVWASMREYQCPQCQQRTRVSVIARFRNDLRIVGADHVAWRD